MDNRLFLKEIFMAFIGKSVIIDLGKTLLKGDYWKWLYRCLILFVNPRGLLND